MRELSDVENKGIMLNILKFIHKTCEENNVNYTLIGGSLIGAVRHKGFIPWDDDMDIILFHDDYIKLINILKNSENGRYKIFDESIDGYFYPYAKVIDTYTIAEEKGLKKIPDYGVFVDIFEYNKFPNNRLLQKIHYFKIKIYMSVIAGYFKNKKETNPLKNIRNKLCNKLNIKKVIKKYNKLSRKYNNRNEKYIISNWPVYGINKEIQLLEYMMNFQDADFEDSRFKITSDYDKLLKNIFGDYMKLPPKSQQSGKHNLISYYKGEKNEKD